MNRFAALLDRLAYEPSRLGKLRLMTDYFRAVGDPDRGFALAALTGTLSFRHAKPALVRTLIYERIDPVLFDLSYDFVGDLSETVALLWPGDHDKSGSHAPRLAEVIATLDAASKLELPGVLARLLDALDETGRWALLKLITGALRVGVSARLAKQAVAELGGYDANAIEDLWHGLAPPYLDLFAHALTEKELEGLAPADFSAEWKWDGIRVQAAVGIGEGGKVIRLYSRTGEEISAAFPDLAEMLAGVPHARFSLDGELLILRAGRVQSFGVLQQRLNRKQLTAALLADFPAHIRAYDLLGLEGEDLRALPFAERRRKLEAFVAAAGVERLDLSPQVAFASWDFLAAARRDPAAAGAGADAAAIEGVMLKRRDSIYVPGRLKGLWYKWKRDPFAVDAVLMYAQRGHGKRSSFYSDFTFGLWRAGNDGDELVPFGKAYFGFTDDELRLLDRYVRDHTTNRFGPVREVTHTQDEGLVLEIAFEGVNHSSRHKSGVAMRFPRISRIRWDKPAREADRLETLEHMIAS